MTSSGWPAWTSVAGGHDEGDHRALQRGGDGDGAVRREAVRIGLADSVASVGSIGAIGSAATPTRAGRRLAVVEHRQRVTASIRAPARPGSGGAAGRWPTSDGAAVAVAVGASDAAAGQQLGQVVVDEGRRRLRRPPRPGAPGGRRAARRWWRTPSTRSSPTARAVRRRAAPRSSVGTLPITFASSES